MKLKIHYKTIILALSVQIFDGLFFDDRAQVFLRFVRLYKCVSDKGSQPEPMDDDICVIKSSITKIVRKYDLFS